MKLVKMSLAAAMLMGASAYAEVKNVQFNGQAKLIYQTTDSSGNTAGLFDQGPNGGGPAFTQAAAGGASLVLGMTADVADGYKFGLEAQAVNSLGLENDVVSDVMWNSGLLSAMNTSQIYLAKTMGNTTVKVGRQELDTPLLFTEKWNVAKNTFDAIVAINSDLPSTTLIAAYVGAHNGGGSNDWNYGGSARTADMTGSSSFASQTGTQGGAYALAAINTAIPNTTLQGWYYNVQDMAVAYWLQADTKVEMLNLGLQYAALDPDASYLNADLEDSAIWAVKASADIEGINVFAAYSDADEDGVAGFANVSTSDKTKIYTGTGSIYMDGIVTSPGTSTYKIGASTKVGGVKLAASYADASDSQVFTAGTEGDISAWDVKASGKVAGLGLTAIYTSMSNDSDHFGGNDLDTLRIIATLPF